MVGTGLGARRGILFKNAIAIEQSAHLDTVVLDKTGTLTRGEPEVVEIKPTATLDEETLLRLVAAVERESEHPLAEAIVRAAAARGIDGGRAEGFEAVAGHGALATVEGRRLAVGNAKLLEREQVALDGIRSVADEMAGQGRTVVHVAVLVCTPLAMLRLTRLVARHRHTSTRTVAAVGVAWIVFAAFGLRFVHSTPVAATSAAGVAVEHARQVRAGIEDRQAFVRPPPSTRSATPQAPTSGR